MLFLLFIFGACIGSFLNVVIYRLPLEKSLLRPPSFCPRCNASIKATDNLPILAWVFLRGRARCCGAKISWRYPFVELLTAILWTITGVLFSTSRDGLYVDAGILTVWLLFVTLMIVITFIDLDYQIIPDELSIGGFIFAIIASALLPQLQDHLPNHTPSNSHLQGLYQALYNGGITVIMVYVFMQMGNFFMRRRLRKLQQNNPEITSVLGLGDVKLMGVFGALFGVHGAMIIFVVATIYGAVGGILARYSSGEKLPINENYGTIKSIIHRWKTGNSVIPFAPYLCASALTWLYALKLL